mmetsp:Transcript_14192/g.29154  ORF Transcript_14192/g.29154 Transcript_14192/m.29154 type:complete len:110 (-) Transcript_14192:2-331(-)
MRVEGVGLEGMCHHRLKIFCTDIVIIGRHIIGLGWYVEGELIGEARVCMILQDMFQQWGVFGVCWEEKVSGKENVRERVDRMIVSEGAGRGRWNETTMVKQTTPYPPPP